jgi:hypothetical protein
MLSKVGVPRDIRRALEAAENEGWPADATPTPRKPIAPMRAAHASSAARPPALPRARGAL